jgi:hypothetical protein
MKQALCVGINRYKNYPRDTLRYCVSDALGMAGFLRDNLGLKAAEITLLQDSQATKGNVMGILKTKKALIVEAALALPAVTHLLAFSQSSHGTQVGDKNGDEGDGLDEALCFYDIAEQGEDWDPATIGVDDEMHALFADMPLNIRLEVWFDACHAGSGLRGMRPRSHRFLPLPSRRGRHFITSRKRFARLLEKQGTYGGGVLWAACGESQESSDGYGNQPYGAFTGSFLANYKTGASRHDLINLIKADLQHRGYAQVPRLECLNVVALKVCGG